MALIFPSDNELFEDLNNVGNKNIDITTHIKNYAFGIVYRAKLNEMFDIDNKNIVNNNWNSIITYNSIYTYMEDAV